MHLEALGAELGPELEERRGKSEVIEHGRMHAVRDAPDLAGQVVQLQRADQDHGAVDAELEWIRTNT